MENTGATVCFNLKSFKDCYQSISNRKVVEVQRWKDLMFNESFLTDVALYSTHRVESINMEEILNYVKWGASKMATTFSTLTCEMDEYGGSSQLWEAL